MASYDLYEIRASSLEDAKKMLEEIMHISFEEHDSRYHRGPYFSFGQMGEENFEVKVNLDPFEDAPNEQDFQHSRFLLYVNNTNRSQELRRMFSNSNGNVVLLRHEELR